MSKDRAAQFVTETPFLPQPLAEAVLVDLVRPATTRDECEAQQMRLASFRGQVAAAIDTIELAVSHNHADYLGGRRCWSYETRIEVDTRLKTLKRQRQHLQEAFGHCNRRIKRRMHEQEHGGSGGTEAPRAVAFVQAATTLLDAETVTLIWDLVDHAHAPGASTDAVR